MKFFAFAAMAFAVFLTGCKDDPKGTNGPDDGKGTAAVLSSFTLDLGDAGTITGVIQASSGTIALRYKDTQTEAIKAATAEVVISQGATISPDPAEEMDYSEEIEFTVTSEDGKTERKYTTAPASYVPTYKAVATEAASLGSVSGGFDALWDDNFDDANDDGLLDSGVDNINNETGVQGADGIADPATPKHAEFMVMGVSNGDVVLANYKDGTAKVFDGKTLAPKGTLNMDIDIVSLYSGASSWTRTPFISWLGTDDKGHLVAAVSGVINDGSNPNFAAGTIGGVTAYIYWKDGWDKAPSFLRGAGATYYNYMSVGGDMSKGRSHINVWQSGIQANSQHVILGFEDGAPATTLAVYYADADQGKGIEDVTKGEGNYIVGNDGCWGQQISAVSGDETGTWFMWDSGDFKNAAGEIYSTSYVYTFDNWGGATLGAGNNYFTPNTKLEGPVNPGAGNSWGGFSRGGIDAFTFNEVPMALAATSNWGMTYVSIVDDLGIFTLKPDEQGATLNYSNSDYDSTQGYNPIPAYYFDEEEQVGYAYVYCPSYGIHSWKISKEEVVE